MEHSDDQQSDCEGGCNFGAVPESECIDLGCGTAPPPFGVDSSQRCPSRPPPPPPPTRMAAIVAACFDAFPPGAESSSASGAARVAELLDGLRPGDLGLPDAMPPLTDVEFIDVIEV